MCALASYPRLLPEAIARLTLFVFFNLRRSHCVRLSFCVFSCFGLIRGGKKDKFAGFGSDDLHAGFTSFTDEPEEYEDVERGGKRGGGRKHINDDDDDDDDLMGDDDDDEDEFDDDVEEDEEDDDDDGDDLDGEAVGNAQPDSMMDLLTG